MVLLEAEDARIDVDGVPALDGLTFRTTGERVLVLGAPRALVLAASGVLPIVRGRLAVAGADAAVAAQERQVAGAALDPPLPPKWSVLEYVGWSARLAGLERSIALASAREAIERMKLGTMSRSLLGGLVPHARRGVVLAAALATRAPVIVIEDPLVGLPDEAANAYAQIVTEALEGRAYAVFAARVPLTSPIALRADEALVMTASRVDAQGPPAELAASEHRFVARIVGGAESLASALALRGASLEVQGAHVLLDLKGAVSTSDLLGLCATAGVAIVELVPIARALA